MGAADGIAEKILYLMRVKNISKEELIERADLSKSTIYNILNGSKNPDISTLEEICKVLDISVGRLLDMKIPTKVDYSVKMDNRTELLEIIDCCSDAQVEKITTFAKFVQVTE